MNWRTPWSWRPGDDPAELLQRLRGIAQRKIAHEFVRAFYLDRDPAHIVRACEEWRRGGMRLPPGWRRAEIWAKGQPRKRGRPSIAPRIVRMLRLAGLFWYWPPEGEGFRPRIPSDVKRALIRECGLSPSEVSKYMSLSRKAMARSATPFPPGARVVTHRIW